MNELFHAVTTRLKTIFTAHAALELEAELTLCHIERKAALLKRAVQLENEGLADLATELRRHASDMDLGRAVECAARALNGPEQNSVASNGPLTPPPTGRKKTR